MKIRFLLLGTSLSIAPQIISAQCISSVQDCYSLGYTQTSCPNGKGVKCPFGSGWYCGGTAAQDCIKLGYDKDCSGAGESGTGETCNGKYKTCTCDANYKYTCTGSGYSGGSGTACGGKYTVCTCADGYEWKDGECLETIPAVSCTIGTLYYSDGKCYNQKVNYKDLLGVVIYEKTDTENGWIIAPTPVTTNIDWGISATDIPGLMNYSSVPNDTQSSCTNTDIITSYGGNSTYPAAWAAKNYRPTGTPSGKRWCLPSGGLLNNINNSTNFNKINNAILTVEGTKLGQVSNNQEWILSSSEYGPFYAWYFHIFADGNFYMNYRASKKEKFIYYSVRPVMEF